MKNSQKQEFTRRLTQCNKGGMIVIIYDIFFAYIQDVKEAFEGNDQEEFKISVRKAQKTLDELIGALDFKYPIAKDLYQLYLYNKNQLAKSMYKADIEPIAEVESIMGRLYSAFLEAAKKDTSGPLMSNTQQVYAGMTYGKNDLIENYTNDDHRGFLV